MPIASRMGAPATVEGGDTVWLDHDTLLVGHGYRTGTAGIAALRVAVPGRRGDRARPAALGRRLRGDAPDVAHLAARPRPRRRLPAHRAGAADGAARRAGDRDRRGARRGVRVDGLERARARAAPRARARGERRDAASDGEGGGRRRHLRGDHISRLGDGGPDLPDPRPLPPAPARRGSEPVTARTSAAGAPTARRRRRRRAAALPAGRGGRGRAGAHARSPIRSASSIGAGERRRAAT